MFIICLFSGVTIEIDVPEITVPEDVGVVEVCASVTNGTLARETVVTVSTVDGTAVGESLTLSSTLLCNSVTSCAS